MATINCTNIKAHSAIRGQGVWVSLSGPESLSVLPVLSEGNECVSESSGAIGYIARIDTYGHSFLVSPSQMNQQFNSDETNTLKVNELITVTY